MEFIVNKIDSISNKFNSISNKFKYCIILKQKHVKVQNTYL